MKTKTTQCQHCSKDIEYFTKKNRIICSNCQSRIIVEPCEDEVIIEEQEDDELKILLKRVNELLEKKGS